MKRSITHPAAALALGVGLAALLAARLGGPAAAAPADAPANRLTDEEAKAGWKLLFDGKSFAGWHNFKRDGVRPGWQVKDGLLVCADPKNAGDLVTADKYGWFELSIEYNISEAGNSGIMFHVTDEGRTVWQTGPEIQLEDNQKARDSELSGWLYQLYKPEMDPKTGKPIDATKPVGEWNHLVAVIAPPPAKSSVTMNGVKYYEFVYNSDDFKARVAKSKFKSMPGFAKSDTGYISLQGDHGSVSFRNIKLRPIPAAGTTTRAID
jgi:3-keto-disaccharide hydrolase